VLPVPSFYGPLDLAVSGAQIRSLSPGPNSSACTSLRPNKPPVATAIFRARLPRTDRVEMTDNVCSFTMYGLFLADIYPYIFFGRYLSI
jgi:hypothetical protein